MPEMTIVNLSNLRTELAHELKELAQTGDTFGCDVIHGQIADVDSVLQLVHDRAEAAKPASRTYSLSRELRGVPHGTHPMEHICTGGDIGTVCAMLEAGCEVYDTTVGELQQLPIGGGITRLTAEHRYLAERES